MAHNINFNERTGRYSFFSVQQKAWHGLGQIVEQYPTSEEAIKHAGLDYEVVKSPLFTKGSGIIETTNGIEIGSTELEVPNYFANIRTDNNAPFIPAHFTKQVATLFEGYSLSLLLF